MGALGPLLPTRLLQLEMELITQCTLSEFKDNWGELQQKLLPHFKELEGEDQEDADMPG